MALSEPAVLGSHHLDNDLAARIEQLEQRQFETDMYVTWLLGRFCVPVLSEVDRMMATRYLERKIAKRRAAAEPPPHLRPRPNGE
jgi:hypothetical protein